MDVDNLINITEKVDKFIFNISKSNFGKFKSLVEFNYLNSH